MMCGLDDYSLDCGECNPGDCSALTPWNLTLASSSPTLCPLSLCEVAVWED